MANYTEALMTEFNFANIDIINILRDGVSTGYEARTHEGYVMCDTTANEVELNPDTNEETQVIYYYRRRGFPSRFDFSKFPWIAVPIESVDEKNIW